MKKIKLLTIIETLGNGGAERALVNILPNLQNKNFICEVVIVFKRDDLANELEKKGIVVHKLNLSFRWNLFEGLYKLNKLVNSNKYDIIHAHLFFAQFYTGLLSIFNKSFKSVVSFHNLSYNTFPSNNLWRKLRKKMDSFIVNKLIDKKVGVSTAVKNHYSDHLNIKEVDVIFNSFSIDNIINSINEKTPVQFIKKYKFIAITPGRLVIEKGHKYLLEAIISINKRINNIGFIIAGGGPLYNNIREDVLERKLKNVYLTGEVKHTEMLNLIHHSNLVISPSISEGFGLVIGESMILGKPIISTNVGGIVDLVTNNKTALLIESKKPKQIFEAVIEMEANKKLRDRLSENAKIKIKEFDVSYISDIWRKYYFDLIS